jgi:hypothetical protein
MIDISLIPRKIKNVYIGADCSPGEIQIYIDVFKDFCDVFSSPYEEIPGINPNIVEHEINTYPDARLVRQHLRFVNPRNSPTTKAKVEKILNVCFIYPIPLTKWVSNFVRMNKKQGTIHICMDVRDLKNYCHKYNFPTPFIDHILDECERSEIFYFIDIFS